MVRTSWPASSSEGMPWGSADCPADTDQMGWDGMAQSVASTGALMPGLRTAVQTGGRRPARLWAPARVSERRDDAPPCSEVLLVPVRNIAQERGTP